MQRRRFIGLAAAAGSMPNIALVPQRIDNPQLVKAILAALRTASDTNDPDGELLLGAVLAAVTAGKEEMKKDLIDAIRLWVRKWDREIMGDLPRA